MYKMNGPQSGFLIVKTFETLYREYEHPTSRHIRLYSVPQEDLEPSKIVIRGQSRIT